MSRLLTPQVIMALSRLGHSCRSAKLSIWAPVRAQLVGQQGRQSIDASRNVGERLFYLINQNQAKIAGAQTPQGGINSAKFSLNFVDAPCSARAVQALAKQR